MKVHLLNEYSSHNLGDAVIYETIAQLLAPLTVHSRLPDDQRTNVRGLRPRGDVQPGDVFLSVGGDIFNNARPWLATRRFVQNVRELSEPDPSRTFLFGQSIPSSCRGLALRALARTLRRLSSVTVRDAQTHRRLRALGVPATLSWDLAFAYQPAPGATAAGRALFDQAGLDASRSVLLSVREFDAMYPGNRADFLTRMSALASRLIQRGHTPAVLIQAASSGGDCDLAMALDLQRATPGVAILCPFSLRGGHRPVDAVVGAIAQARAVVAVRYHMAVLRLLAGRRPYSLHYSNKGQDLADRLALPGSSLQAFDPDAAVADIEASTQLLHDHAVQAISVREAFDRGIALATSCAHRPAPRSAGLATG